MTSEFKKIEQTRVQNILDSLEIRYHGYTVKKQSKEERRRFIQNELYLWKMFCPRTSHYFYLYRIPVLDYSMF